MNDSDRTVAIYGNFTKYLNELDGRLNSIMGKIQHMIKEEKKSAKCVERKGTRSHIYLIKDHIMKRIDVEKHNMS